MKTTGQFFLSLLIWIPLGLFGSEPAQFEPIEPLAIPHDHYHYDLYNSTCEKLTEAANESDQVRHLKTLVGILRVDRKKATPAIVTYCEKIASRTDRSWDRIKYTLIGLDVSNQAVFGEEVITELSFESYMKFTQFLFQERSKTIHDLQEFSSAIGVGYDRWKFMREPGEDNSAIQFNYYVRKSRQLRDDLINIERMAMDLHQRFKQDETLAQKSLIRLLESAGNSEELRAFTNFLNTDFDRYWIVERSRQIYRGELNGWDPGAEDVR